MGLFAKYINKYARFVFLFFLVSIILYQLLMPVVKYEQIKAKSITGYAKREIKIKKNNSSEFTRKLRRMERINVIKDEQTGRWIIYDKSGEKAGYIDDEDIVFENTPEYYALKKSVGF